MFGDLEGQGADGQAPAAARGGAERPVSRVRLPLRLSGRLYGELARRRREWYRQHPEARRRLANPVISVGNLTVGGSGKTPVVEHLARLLLDLGERPAILSRGYRRRDPADGVVTVREPDRIRTDLARAGDEPLMLARGLDGTAVLVSSSRYLAGRLAERRYGCTVHLLDDGFQHLPLHRDVDLLVARRADLEQAQPLPAGRLREPLDAARDADAVILFDESTMVARAVATQLGVARGFSAVRLIEDARLFEPRGRQVAATPLTRVLAVAGVAVPERFLEDVRAAGWTVAGRLVFRDHHPYTRDDVETIMASARQVRADLILTTAKDAVRLAPHRPCPVAVAWLPMTVAVEPPAAFRAWIVERLAAARHPLDQFVVPA